LTGPCLVTVNHYSRPGFRAWWIALGISAVIPAEVHWVVTAAWTFPGRWWRRYATPLSGWVLRQAASVYGFTSTPPMPPEPHEYAQRAWAVRRVLSYAHQAERPLIGLAPEGRDFPDGRLGPPPPGAGRFIQLLADAGLQILPVGAYEADGSFCLRFGPPYALQVPSGLSAAQRDAYASQVVMQQIAEQLCRGAGRLKPAAEDMETHAGKDHRS
jgi:hypothetical protein